jgi:hypothetical protein
LQTSENGILAAQANGTAGGNGARNGRKTDGLTAATDLPAGGTQVSISGAGPPSSGDSALLAARGPAGSGAAEAGVAETAAAAAVLRAGGWRVITVDATTPLAVAWQQLPRSGSAHGSLERGFGTAR